MKPKQKQKLEATYLERLKLALILIFGGEIKFNPASPVGGIILDKYTLVIIERHLFNPHLDSMKITFMPNANPATHIYTATLSNTEST